MTTLATASAVLAAMPWLCPGHWNLGCGIAWAMACGAVLWAWAWVLIAA